MDYTRTMPQAEMERFLIVCRELDDLTDEMNEASGSSPAVAFIMQQITALRSVRDDIAGTFPWTAVTS